MSLCTADTFDSLDQEAGILSGMRQHGGAEAKSLFARLHAVSASLNFVQLIVAG